MGKNKFFTKNRIRIGQVFMFAVSLVILFTESSWKGKGLAGDIFFLFGIALAGTGTVGRIWCSLYISGYKKDVLITTGPYSMCRNPLYFFSLVGTVGVGLATMTLTIPAIIFGAFIIYYPIVIEREEERLSGLYGESFKQYRKSIPRFIPSFSGLREPENYNIKPKYLRGRLFDSLWFIWMVGIVSFINALHDHAVIPVLFRLY